MKLLMKDNPCVTAPRIDKLAGVVDLKDAGLCGQAYGGIIDWLNQHEVGVSKLPSSGKFQLKVKVHYPVGNEPVHGGCPFVLLQITHPKLSKRQARIEYNPLYLTETAEEYLDVQFLELFGMGFYEFLYHARFTRVDWCREIMLRDVEDYLFRAKWSKVTQCFFNAKGKLETLYLGRSSSTQIIVYDKSKELYGEDAEQGMIRVEARCKINLTIHGLAAMKNPFERVDVFSIGCKNPPYGTAHWRAFRDSCRLRGITNAIKMQPADHRAKLKKMLCDHAVLWWAIAADDWEWLITSALDNAGLTQIPNTAPPLNLDALTGTVA